MSERPLQTAQEPTTPRSATASHHEISDHSIAAIIKRLELGQTVKRYLPHKGYLHIDRQLPFLIVYRRPAGVLHTDIEQLLRGEAAYLIIDGSEEFFPEASRLVTAIASAMAKSFGAFLIIEMWEGSAEEFAALTPDFRPAFRVFAHRSMLLSDMIQRFTRALERVKVQQVCASVETVASTKPWPSGLPRLISANSMRAHRIQQFGVAIRPVLRNVETAEEFPLLRRSIHRGLGRAIRQSVFAFVSDYTTSQPPHYHALGPRSLVRLVWEVDEALAKIGDQFDFLLTVSPTNTAQAWELFKRNHYQQAPRFLYRPIPVDPPLVKRALYRIPIEKIEDPALEALFRAQQRELDLKLSMLEDRNTSRFFYASLQLYGQVENKLLNVAQAVLQALPPDHGPDEGMPTAKKLDSQEFAQKAEALLNHYRSIDPRLTSRVEIRDDVMGVMVSQGNLLINKRQKIAVDRVDALLAHEVGTHIVTYFNGLQQPLRQLHLGLPDYEELQEGLAVFAEYLVGGLTKPRLRLLAGRVIAAHHLTEGQDFISVYRALCQDYGFSPRTAFNLTTRIFRGGGLLKDMVYFRGLQRVLDYLGKGESLDPLWIGKFGAKHLKIINELRWRKVLKPAALIPHYLDNSTAQARLKKITANTQVLSLLNEAEQ